MSDKNEYDFIKLFGKIDSSYVERAAAPWKKKKFYQRRGVQAACAVLAAVFHTNVQAGMQHFTTLIGQMFGATADISSYEEIRNTSITKNGVTVTLNEVMLTQDSMIITYTLNEKAESSLMSVEAKINGQEAGDWSTGTSMNTSNGKVNIEEYHYGDKFADVAKADLNITFQTYLDEDGTEGDQFVFEFSSDFNKVRDRTQSYSLNQELQLAENCKMQFQQIDLNQVMIMLKAKCDGLDFEKGDIYFLKCVDDKGRQFTLIMSKADGEANCKFVNDDVIPEEEKGAVIEMQMYKSEFIVDNYEVNDLDDELCEEIESGYYDDEEVPVGDKFTVVLE